MALPINVYLKDVFDYTPQAQNNPESFLDKTCTTLVFKTSWNPKLKSFIDKLIISGK
jgi:hypothetical protein